MLSEKNNTKQLKIHFFCIFFSFIFCFYVQNGNSYNANTLKKEISKKEQEIKTKKKEIEKLKKYEKNILNDLILLNNKINKIENEIKEYQKRLDELKKYESNINRNIQKLKKDLNKNRYYLNSIINILWKTYLHQHFLSTPNNYDYLTLKLKWLTSLYKAYNKKLEEIYIQESTLKRKKEELKKTKQQIKRQIQLIENKKDELLKNKMLLFTKLKEIRAQTIQKKNELDEIIETVEEIKYKLRILEKKKFCQAKGILPWPVNQKYFKKHRKGIIIKTNKLAPVLACFWGKVVYTGKLRGFGDVVIVFHGNSYYTLYAFLSKTTVKTGDEVKQGDIIGLAGFCPYLKASGIYFEIRHGKDSLDPVKWLK